MKQGDKLKLTITGINNEGEGVVRTSDCGFVLFVPGALLGEEVTARIVTLKRNYGIAKVLERHNSSPDRTSPRCPAFGRCGGCQLQHMNYDAQLKLKTQTVFDALVRIGGIEAPPVEACVPSPLQWGYRNKASLPVQQGPCNKLATGFYRARSHDIIPFDRCPVLLPQVERIALSALSAMKEYGVNGYNEARHNDAANFIRHIVLRAAMFTDESLCGIVSCRTPDRADTAKLKKVAERLSQSAGGVILNVNQNAGNFIWGGNFSTIAGNQTMTERLNNRELKFEVSSFFQVNSGQTVNLYNCAAGLALSDAPGNILELYSGVGSLTVFLAGGADCVTAVESWEPAAKYMRENAEKNGLSNITPYTAPAEEISAKLSDKKFDAAVLDPPRTGCAPEVINSLLKIAPPKIVYVSCNPATLARDIKPLVAAGYELKTVRPFDMFPQTAHVETVVLMSRVQK